MQLAHTGDNGLPGLFVGVSLEGGVLLGQLHQGNAHLLLTGLGLGLNGHADHGLGELHGLQDHRMLLIAEGVTGGGVLEAHGGSDIAGVHRLDILSVVGVHLQNTTHALLLILGGVEDRGAGVERTGVNPEETQTAHIGVGHNLESQRGEGLVIRGLALFLLVGAGVDTLNGGNIGRCGHIVHNGVQQLLYALVAVRSTADNRDHFHSHGSLTDRLTDLVSGDVLTIQVHLHDLIVEHGHGIQHLLTVLLGQIHHVLRNILYPHVLAHLVVVDVGLHFHQIDDPAEIGLFADGQLDGDGVTLETLVNHPQNIVEIGTHDVHLVDVNHAGHVIVIRLTPHGLRLGLHAALGAHNGHTAVQHAQGALHLYGEVNVARGVDNVDTGLGELVLGSLPVAGGSSGGNGDTALLLLGHPVHGSRTLVGFTDLIVHTGIIQDTLRSGGLTCINVSHNADISCVFQ